MIKVRKKPEPDNEEKEYKIYYSYNGYGTAYVTAISEQQAKDMFNDDECSEYNEDDGDGYQIEEINEI